jgi:hypothetical protein
MSTTIDPWREAADLIWEIGKRYEGIDRALAQRIEDFAVLLHNRSRLSSLPPKEDDE